MPKPQIFKLARTQTSLIFLILFFVNLSEAQDQEDKSVHYVARYAMQTVKSKNFKDLAENLFSNTPEGKEIITFLTKHDLLKRSLPDVIAEGSEITIKERKRNTTLDLSQINSMKLIFNKEVIPFNGQESFVDIYQKFTKIQRQRQVSYLFSFFYSEAQADMLVLATVTLAHYAKASMMERCHQQDSTSYQDPTRSLSSKSQTKLLASKKSKKVKKK